MDSDKRISGPAEYAAGWDKIDSITEPLDRDGIPYVLVLGIPGTSETRSVSSGGFTKSDHECIMAGITNHFLKFPPAENPDV